MRREDHENRWLHHTSFLWDFREEMMRYLKHPAKTPAYRVGRAHLDFLAPLSGVLPERDALPDRIEPALQAMGLKTVRVSVEEAEAAGPSIHPIWSSGPFSGPLIWSNRPFTLTHSFIRSI